MRSKKIVKQTPLRKLQKKVDGLQDMLIEIKRLMEEERTICSRCGFAWGEHRHSDLACLVLIDKDGHHFHDKLKFKPLYS